MANNYQGIYSALPQSSLSDSDSDKEMASVTRPNTFRENNPRNNGEVEPELLKLEELGKRYDSKLSPKRKCMFWLAIAVLFCTLIGFLWALPCSKKGTCPKRLSNWEIQHEGIELTGKINIVKSTFEGTNNVVLFFDKNLLMTDSHGGLIAMLGDNGIIAWYVAQSRIPKTMDCHKIDANQDGATDCVLLGDMGLEVIDPLSGLIVWHARDRLEKKIMRTLDFPFFLSDLNNDNVGELLTVSNGAPYHPRFILLSGKLGLVIGETFVDQCDEIHIEQIDSYEVTYSCLHGNRVTYHQVALLDLVSNMFKMADSFATHETNFVRPTSTYTLTGHKLFINNYGKCPTCHVDISLVDSQTNETIISWSYPNSYTFVPVFFSFKSPETAILLSGHVDGFILKFWQWFGVRPKETIHKFPHITSKRSIPPGNGTIQINSIMERIVLVTFNDTDFNVVNASLTEVTQLCFPDEYVICQPSLEKQNNSMLITDIDADGTQELISYSSGFVRKNETKEWSLVSTMKLIRLEAELPKLYGVKPKPE